MIAKTGKKTLPYFIFLIIQNIRGKIGSSKSFELGQAQDFTLIVFQQRRPTFILRSLNSVEDSFSWNNAIHSTGGEILELIRRKSKAMDRLSLKIEVKHPLKHSNLDLL